MQPWVIFELSQQILSSCDVLHFCLQLHVVSTLPGGDVPICSKSDEVGGLDTAANEDDDEVGSIPVLLLVTVGPCLSFSGTAYSLMSSSTWNDSAGTC